MILENRKVGYKEENMSQTEKIDILDRAKIMNDIEQILVLLSEQKQGRVFALDGKWGYGKTYILEQLEKKLEVLQKEGTNDDRFYVFHYNCWNICLYIQIGSYK